LQEVSKVK